MMTGTLKATPIRQRIKFGSIEAKFASDGNEIFKVKMFLPYGQGFSKYPTELFLRGDVETMASILKGCAEGILLTAELTPAKVKADKKDDGKFGSYFWNLTDFALVGTDKPLASSAKPQMATDEPLFLPEENQRRFTPSTYDARQQGIEAGWAIDQGRQWYQFLHQYTPRPSDELHIEEILSHAFHFLGIHAELVAARNAQDVPQMPRTARESPIPVVEASQTASFEERLNKLYAWAMEKYGLPADLALKTAGLKVDQITEKTDLRWVAQQIVKVQKERKEVP